MSNVKWGRVVGAGIAALFADDLLFAVVPFTAWFLGPVSGWLTPALAAGFAFWVGRTVADEVAVQHGLLVGAVAGVGTLIIGLPGFAVLPALLTVVAGALGGAIGRHVRPAAESPGDSSHEPAPRS